MYDEINDLRLEEVKKRILCYNKEFQDVINRLIEILEDEKGCNEGSLTSYDIVKIYELLTDELV